MLQPRSPRWVVSTTFGIRTPDALVVRAADEEAVAAIISAGLMLEFLGEADAAARILNAVDKTDDVEGTTAEIGDAIAAAC